MRDNYEDTRVWYGFDLDYCAAEGHSPYRSDVIGEPVPAMIELMRKMISDGKRVKIFTARVCETGQKSPWSNAVANAEYAEKQHSLIDDWCFKHLGMHLEATSIKDFLCEEIYDDRAWRVEKNTGKIVGKDIFIYEHAFMFPPNFGLMGPLED